MRLFAHFSIAAAATMIVSLSACTKENPAKTGEDIVGRHVCRMTFNGSVNGYDNKRIKSTGTKADATSWTDGDVIYVIFHAGSELVMGEGTYSTTNGWKIWYDGDLSNCSNACCEVRYFVNPAEVKTNYVSLNPQTEIYETVTGSYSYDNGNLVVSASLVPKVGRIRFKGTPNATLYIHGVTAFTSFSCFSNLFDTSGVMMKTVVNADGYTPYIYGTFTDNDKRLILIGNDFAYTRLCPSEVLSTGTSGYMSVPTKQEHVNWLTGAIYQVDDVAFKMITVGGYGSLFLIAETETTEALYYSVMGTPSTSMFPIDNVSSSEFITMLNKKTQASFTLPGSSEWEFCAKGGNKSMGFTYSGSNSIADVAWYADNCSDKQPVKTKAPNELGLFDMSGNVEEMTKLVETAYTPYYQYTYGGSYKSEASHCYPSSYNSHKYSVSPSKGIGFRLKLALPI